MKGKIKSFKYYKWNTLIGFALFYNTVYIERSISTKRRSGYGRIRTFFLSATPLIFQCFVAYALGSLINGILVDKHSAKAMIVLGEAFRSWLMFQLLLYMHGGLSCCCL